MSMELHTSPIVIEGQDSSLRMEFVRISEGTGMDEITVRLSVRCSWMEGQAERPFTRAELDGLSLVLCGLASAPADHDHKGQFQSNVGWLVLQFALSHSGKLETQVFLSGPLPGEFDFSFEIHSSRWELEGWARTVERIQAEIPVLHEPRLKWEPGHFGWWEAKDPHEPPAMMAAYSRDAGVEGSHIELLLNPPGMRELGDKLIAMAESLNTYEDQHYASVTGGGPFDGELIEKPQPGWRLAHYLDIRMLDQWFEGYRPSLDGDV